MSWDIFKQRMIQKGQNQNGVSIDGYAKTFATEYDRCIKRGHDSFNFISLQKGNVELLETSLRLLLTSQQSLPTQRPLILEIGNTIITYWLGGVMNSFPVPESPVGAGIPYIPAPGSFYNVNIVNNIVINPGVWTTNIPILPTTNEKGWLDSFILAAKVHLTTIQGLITTTSLYPPFGTPAPGIIFWQGYTVR